MKNARVYINSTDYTAEQRWGIIFSGEALTALMTPAGKKEYIKNESPLMDGEEILSVGDYTPKTAARDIQLMIGLRARSFGQFLTNYRSFVSELEKGTFDITVYAWEGNDWFKETYHLNYVSCSQYSEFNGRLAKFVLKLREPNPKNRVFESNII